MPRRDRMNQVVAGTWAGRGARSGALLALLACAVMTGVSAGCANNKRSTEGMTVADLSDTDTWKPIGFSVAGRSIEAMTVGEGSVRVLVIGGIHGDEVEAQPSIGRLTEMLMQEPGARAATWRVIRDLNPDGTSIGRRGNERNVDLNRNFPARNFVKKKRHGDNPFSEPESNLLARMVEFDRPELIVVFHSTSNGPYVNFDGPASAAARAFADGAATTDPRWRIVPEMSYATPGSLGSYFGQDRAIPILTIEFQRDQDPMQVWLAIEAGFTSLARHLLSSTIEEGIGR